MGSADALGIRSSLREREARLLIAAAVEAAKLNTGSPAYWGEVVNKAAEVEKHKYRSCSPMLSLVLQFQPRRLVKEVAVDVL